MITNQGKDIIAKYLLGEAPAYASHISIGCGAKPLDANDAYPSASVLSEKEVMDFEMMRVPIVSRGFVDDNGVTKIALTAELPKENRYDITEIGLWSAGANNLATNSDSHIIFSFSEPWQKNDSNLTDITKITTISSSSSIGDIGVTQDVFSVATDNQTLKDGLRMKRKEGPRYLNNTILMRGDTSKISPALLSITSASANGSKIIYSHSASSGFTVGQRVTISGMNNSLLNFFNQPITGASASQFAIDSTITASTSGTGGYAWITGTFTAASALSTSPVSIQLGSVNLNANNNSPSDKFKLAFSLIDKNALSSGDPDIVKILIKFSKTTATNTEGFATIEIALSGSSFSYPGNGRYRVVEIPLSELYYSGQFTLAEARICSIFTSIEESSVPSSDYYIAFDGFRIDNITTENPLYKMAGYSVVKYDGKPVTKFNNTNNYVEFRMALGIT